MSRGINQQVIFEDDVDKGTVLLSPATLHPLPPAVHSAGGYFHLFCHIFVT